MKIKGPGQLRQRLQAAERESLQQGRQIAVTQSSGSYSTAELRRMDHPYAKRHGAAQLNAGVLNRQSGQLVEGWRGRGPKREAGELRGAIYNNTDHARLVKAAGKAGSTSVARPIEDRVAEKLKAPRLQRLQQAARRQG